MLFSRRDFLASAALLPLTARSFASSAATVALLLPGARDDKGFMQAGYEGFQRATDKLDATTRIIDRVRPEKDLLVDALRTLAADSPRLIAAHGGQCNQAVAEVAKDFPDIQFVVIQGNVAGANMTSYEVLQEQSAWLAGAYAALTTKTGIVGHISGIRVPPGLKGRAGYAAGVAAANPDVKLLTTFCGEQDDTALAREVTLAQAKAGADVIFTMLNAGRTGAIEGCREAGISQIGNVRDWHPVAPDVFVASAIADVSVAMQSAVTELVSGKAVPGEHVRVGLENKDAVRLAMSPETPEKVRQAIDTFAQQIAAGEIVVATDYAGAEFTPS